MSHERLKGERHRIAATQPAIAEYAGVSRRTIVDWETGKSSPTAVQLAKLARHGVDILYVVTGERSEPVQIEQTLSPDERALLATYRVSDTAGKRLTRSVSQYTAQQQTVRMNEGTVVPE